MDLRADEGVIKAHAVASAMAAKACLSGFERSASWNDVWPCTEAMIEQELNALAVKHHAVPCAKRTKLSGRIARMLDVSWWRRSVRGRLLVENEAVERRAGVVRRKAQCYVSDYAIKRKRERAKCNQLMLEGMEVCNENGEAVPLADVVVGSVSNPKLRRAELMTRCRGFEEAARFAGHVAYFLTITTPSRFHRFAGSGQENKRWDGSTPRDGQDYLCSVWAKTRAALKRLGAVIYGFRVVEPHHDGTPHWHMLLFFTEQLAQVVIDTVRKYAMAESPTEPGADKHRFTAELIDTSKGSATGYIAKYISKNIDGLREDGEAMGLDFASGTDAASSSERVRIWASTHHIRQFQQIGGPSVTVWRELRRLGAVDEGVMSHQRDLFDGPQNAADRGMWAMFWILQGGPEVPRSELSLRPLSEKKENKYGEEVPRVRGVLGVLDGIEHQRITREHEWVIQPRGMADTLAADYEFKDYMNREKAIAAFNAAAVGCSDLGAGAACAPWTRVNNCTGGDRESDPIAVFDFSGFDTGGGGSAISAVPVKRGDPSTVAEEVTFLEKQQCQQQKQWNELRSSEPWQKKFGIVHPIRA